MYLQGTEQGKWTPLCDESDRQRLGEDRLGLSQGNWLVTLIRAQHPRGLKAQVPLY